jgi:hypothetical protein
MGRKSGHTRRSDEDARRRRIVLTAAKRLKIFFSGMIAAGVALALFAALTRLMS